MLCAIVTSVASKLSDFHRNPIYLPPHLSGPHNTQSTCSLYAFLLPSWHSYSWVAGRWSCMSSSKTFLPCVLADHPFHRLRSENEGETLMRAVDSDEATFAHILIWGFVFVMKFSSHSIRFLKDLESIVPSSHFRPGEDADNSSVMFWSERWHVTACDGYKLSHTRNTLLSIRSDAVSSILIFSAILWWPLFCKLVTCSADPAGCSISYRQ